MLNTYKNEFEQRGYFVIENMLKPSDIQRYANKIESDITTLANLINVSRNDYLSVVARWGGKNSMVEFLQNEIAPLMQPIVDNCTGQSLFPDEATLFRKSGFAMCETHGHQDISYRGNRGQYALSSWLTFDETTLKSGALTVLPNSHHGPIEVRQDFLSAHFLDRAHTQEWENNEVILEVPAGSVVVFDSRLWHAAKPMSDSSPRRALAIRWFAKDKNNFTIPQAPDTPNSFGMDTSGKLLKSALIKRLSTINKINTDGMHSDALVDTSIQLICTGHLTLTKASIDTLNKLQIHFKAEKHHGTCQNGMLWELVRDTLIPELIR